MREVPRPLRKLLSACSSDENVESVVLFGSRARGDYTVFSDYDVLIVVSKSDERFIDRPLKYACLVEGAVDLFVYTTREVEEMFEQGNPLILDALQQGIALFDRGFWSELRAKFEERLRRGDIKPVKLGWEVRRSKRP